MDYLLPTKSTLLRSLIKGAVEFGTWKQKELKPNTTFAEGECSGVYFTFDLDKKKDIQYKIGVSYVSVDNARKNLRMENAGWNFDEIRGEAEKSWNHYLSKIEVEGDNADRITQFYTHL